MGEELALDVRPVEACCVGLDPVLVAASQIPVSGSPIPPAAGSRVKQFLLQAVTAPADDGSGSSSEKQGKKGSLKPGVVDSLQSLQAELQEQAHIWPTTDGINLSPLTLAAVQMVMDAAKQTARQQVIERNDAAYLVLVREGYKAGIVAQSCAALRAVLGLRILTHTQLAHVIVVSQEAVFQCTGPKAPAVSWAWRHLQPYCSGSGGSSNGSGGGSSSSGGSGHGWKLDADVVWTMMYQFMQTTLTCLDCMAPVKGMAPASVMLRKAMAGESPDTPEEAASAAAISLLCNLFQSAAEAGVFGDKGSSSKGSGGTSSKGSSSRKGSSSNSSSKGSGSTGPAKSSSSSSKGSGSTGAAKSGSSNSNGKDSFMDQAVPTLASMGLRYVRDMSLPLDDCPLLAAMCRYSTPVLAATEAYAAARGLVCAGEIHALRNSVKQYVSAQLEHSPYAAVAAGPDRSLRRTLVPRLCPSAPLMSLHQDLEVCLEQLWGWSAEAVHLCRPFAKLVAGVLAEVAVQRDIQHNSQEHHYLVLAGFGAWWIVVGCHMLQATVGIVIITEQQLLQVLKACADVIEGVSLNHPGKQPEPSVVRQVGIELYRRLQAATAAPSGSSSSGSGSSGSMPPCSLDTAFNTITSLVSATVVMYESEGVVTLQQALRPVLSRAAADGSIVPCATPSIASSTKKQPSSNSSTTAATSEDFKLAFNALTGLSFLSPLTYDIDAQPDSERDSSAGQQGRDSWGGSLPGLKGFFGKPAARKAAKPADSSTSGSARGPVASPAQQQQQQKQAGAAGGKAGQPAAAGAPAGAAAGSASAPGSGAAAQQAPKPASAGAGGSAAGKAAQQKAAVPSAAAPKDAAAASSSSSGNKAAAASSSSSGTKAAAAGVAAKVTKGGSVTAVSNGSSSSSGGAAASKSNSSSSNSGGSSSSKEYESLLVGVLRWYCTPETFTMEMRALPEKHLEALKHFKLHTTAKTKGWNALHYACAAHRVGLVQQLLQAGADVNMHEDIGIMQPLHLACLGRVQDVTQFEELKDVLTAGKQDAFAEYAAAAGPACFPLVQLLVEAGANLNAKMGLGELLGFTPLHLLMLHVPSEGSTARGVLFRNPFVGKAMWHLPEYVTPGIQAVQAAGLNPCNRRLVHEAIWASSWASGEYCFLRDGPTSTELFKDITKWDDQHEGCLQQLQAVRLLLLRGATVDTETCKAGETPLMLAAKWENASAAYMLLRAGADPEHQRLVDGARALDLAIGQGSVRTAWVLLCLGAEAVPAWSRGGKAMPRVGYGATVNVSYGFEYHVYNIMCFNDSPWSMYVVQHLLAGGAAIDAIPPDTKETPLHFAVRLGNVELVRMLVQAGADVNARDALDKMPPAATVLTKCREPSAVGEIVQILIDAGTDLHDWQDEHTSYDLVQMAANCGNMDAVLRFVEAGARWRTPPALRVVDGTVFYPPEILVIQCPNTKMSFVEGRLKLAEKKGKQKRAAAAAALEPWLSPAVTPECKEATLKTLLAAGVTPGRPSERRLKPQSAPLAKTTVPGRGWEWEVVAAGQSRVHAAEGAAGGAGEQENWEEYEAAVMAGLEALEAEDLALAAADARGVDSGSASKSKKKKDNKKKGKKQQQAAKRVANLRVQSAQQRGSTDSSGGSDSEAEVVVNISPSLASQRQQWAVLQGLDEEGQQQPGSGSDAAEEAPAPPAAGSKRGQQRAVRQAAAAGSQSQPQSQPQSAPDSVGEEEEEELLLVSAAGVQRTQAAQAAAQQPGAADEWGASSGSSEVQGLAAAAGAALTAWLQQQQEEQDSSQQQQQQQRGAAKKGSKAKQARQQQQQAASAATPAAIGAAGAQQPSAAAAAPESTPAAAAAAAAPTGATAAGATARVPFLPPHLRMAMAWQPGAAAGVPQAAAALAGAGQSQPTTHQQQQHANFTPLQQRMLELAQQHQQQQQQAKDPGPSTPQIPAAMRALLSSSAQHSTARVAPPPPPPQQQARVPTRSAGATRHPAPQGDSAAGSSSADASAQGAAAGAAQGAAAPRGGGKLCVVCDEQRRNVLLIPCNHIVLCDACAQLLSAKGKLDSCPQCGAGVRQHIKVHKS